MTVKIDPTPIRFEAQQIVAELVRDRVMLKIETDQGPVVVHMQRSVLQQFFEQSIGLRQQ
jgi:hypothetical protein